MVLAPFSLPYQLDRLAYSTEADAETPVVGEIYLQRELYQNLAPAC